MAKARTYGKSPSNPPKGWRADRRCLRAGGPTCYVVPRYDAHIRAFKARAQSINAYLFVQALDQGTNRDEAEALYMNPCKGEAHNPEVGGMIDNCLLCAPFWGIVPKSHPVSV